MTRDMTKEDIANMLDQASAGLPLTSISPQDWIYRPLRIILVRHGESEANVDRKITSHVPDHAVHLTAKGRRQALEAGNMLSEIIDGQSVAFIVSPYVRTRETFHGIARAFGPVHDLNVRLDVQIREQDHGNFDRPDIKHFHDEKAEFGQFYYRFPDGESMADVYDRASIFIESLYRRWELSREQNLVIVSHGIFLTVFLMRLFRFSLDELYSLEQLKNCELVVLERAGNHKFYDIGYTWCPGCQKDMQGLAKKPAHAIKEHGRPIEMWNGDPDAELFVSQTRRSTWQPGFSKRHPRQSSKSAAQTPHVDGVVCHVRSE
jgi:broad specificity phosphatase PhoE